MAKGNEVTEVKIVPSRIKTLSTQIRSALALANSAMDNGDYDSAVTAEAALIKAYKEWHDIQESRRPKDGVSR